MNALLLLLVLSAPGDGLPVPDDGKWGMSLRAEAWTELPASTPEERAAKEAARKLWVKKLRQEEAFFLRNLRKQRLYLRNYTPPFIETHVGHPTR